MNEASIILRNINKVAIDYNEEQNTSDLEQNTEKKIGKFRQKREQNDKHSHYCYS